MKNGSSAARMPRREALKLGAAAAVAAGAAKAGMIPFLGMERAHAMPGSDAGQYEVIANAFGFAVDIPGAPRASSAVLELNLEDLTIDRREFASGVEASAATRPSGADACGPGAVGWGSASITVPRGFGDELRLWFNDAAKGKNIRKNITVTLFKSDKTSGRSYTLYDCFPVCWSAVNFDTSSTVQTETLTVKVGRVEFST